MSLERKLTEQTFANGYELVNGVAMHRQNGRQFQIPHAVLKKHIGVAHFVELRIDSSRFSAHPDAPEQCICEFCKGVASKPVLTHEQPASLVPLPPQNVPSRGWGEDFWVKIVERRGDFLRGVVDNPLYEARLHDLRQGHEILCHLDHVLAIHPIHRQEMVLGMVEADLRQLVEWLGTL